MLYSSTPFISEDCCRELFDLVPLDKKRRRERAGDLGDDDEGKQGDDSEGILFAGGHSIAIQLGCLRLFILDLNQSLLSFVQMRLLIS